MVFLLRGDLTSYVLPPDVRAHLDAHSERELFFSALEIQDRKGQHKRLWLCGVVQGN